MSQEKKKTLLEELKADKEFQEEMFGGINPFGLLIVIVTLYLLS